MRLRTPRPSPIAVPELICDVDPEVEPPPEPNGAPSITLAQVPFKHILLLPQSLSAEHSALGVDDGVAPITLLNVLVVELRVELIVSRLNCLLTVEEVGVPPNVVVLVAEDRFDVVELVVDCRRVLRVVDIIIRRTRCRCTRKE